MNDKQFESIYVQVQPWFSSKQEALLWYKKNTIPSFGATPEQIVKKHGIAALEDWIKTKKLGGFE